MSPVDPHGLAPFKKGQAPTHQKRMPSPWLIRLAWAIRKRPSLVLFGTVPQTAASWQAYVRHFRAQGLDPCSCQTWRCGMSTTSCQGEKGIFKARGAEGTMGGAHHAGADKARGLGSSFRGRYFDYYGGAYPFSAGRFAECDQRAEGSNV